MVPAKNLRVEDAHWEDIYDYVSICGTAHDPKSLVIEALNQLQGFCSFDQALVYFLDGNGKVCDQYLMDIDECWSTMYLQHYFAADNNRYSYFLDTRDSSNRITFNPNKTALYTRDWDNELSTELVPNLIRPRGLKYTCAFVLYDLTGNCRAIVALDRLKNKNFSSDELLNLQLIIPHLNNLHKNFFYQGFSQNSIKRSIWDTANLTAREIEVADLLCMGISPANIGRTLHITLATAYKHIANIYKKMHVSSQQELLVRMLRNK